jgi:hypothetical protein
MSADSFDVPLLTYTEVLERIQNTQNHLLLGNGFNRGLGVNTSYSNIFKKMIEEDFSLYEEAKSLVEECEYDLERFIGRLEEDIQAENNFLRKFVHNKVKMDFMKAIHGIVKAAIKNVYAEENQGVYLLLKSFTNYFTLNYDPLLYLLLLHYSPVQGAKDTALAMQPTLKFIEEDLNIKSNDIYAEIKQARENGKLTLTVSGVDDINTTSSKLKTLKKVQFIAVITEYSEKNNKGWKRKDIAKVVDILLEEEKRKYVLKKVDDGSRPQSLFDEKTEYVFDTHSTTQNLFFLHGAFHMYKDRKHIKKITQRTDKALYDRIEEILNDNDRELVCVFQTKDKMNAINENDYLKNCLNKLGTLSGVMVIIGSSLDDNDDHIFEQINQSRIESLYISTLKEHKVQMFEKAAKKFPAKSVHLFDALTISYYVPDSKP